MDEAVHTKVCTYPHLILEVSHAEGRACSEKRLKDLERWRTHRSIGNDNGAAGSVVWRQYGDAEKAEGECQQGA